MKNVINLDKSEYEVIDDSKYCINLDDHFNNIPEIAKPLIKDAKAAFSKIEEMLYCAPAVINAVKAAIPDITLQAVFTDEQKRKLAKGVLKLMTKKDGSLLAELVNPKSNKIVAQIPLKEIQLTPEMSQAMVGLSNSMQMAQIAEQIQLVQKAVEEVRQGQEYDRLATAYSCQQRFLQAVEIVNPQLRSMALLQLAASAEDSRNLLILSQKTNVKFISDQPDSFFGKMVSGAKPEKIDARMNEIRDSLCAVNMVSFTEAMAYQELGEYEAAKKSLTYYSDFIKSTYLSIPGLVERLDLIDKSPENYWTKTLPNINKKIQELPCVKQVELLA